MTKTNHKLGPPSQETDFNSQSRRLLCISYCLIHYYTNSYVYYSQYICTYSWSLVVFVNS